MRLGRTFALLLAFALPALSRPAGAAVVIQDGFEPPATVLGNIGGQNGWTGAPGQDVVTATMARSGAQSLVVANRAQYAFPGGSFGIHSNPFWYMEGWLYARPMPPGQQIYMYASSGLGMAFYIRLTGDGVVQMNSGIGFTDRALGSSAFDRWLRFRIEKIDHLWLQMSVVGDGVNENFVVSFNTPWNPSHFGLSFEGPPPPGGGPCWDDVFMASDQPTPAGTTSWGRIKQLYR